MKTNHTYNMFLDDLRDPPIVAGRPWIIVRSFAEATAYVEQHGMPTFISFDHDLGEEAPTGYDFAKWLVNRHLDGITCMPDEFQDQVHSANPPGAANIRGLLDRFLHFLAEDSLG